MTLTLANEPILANEDELPLLRALSARLDATAMATLLGPDDEPILLPESAYRSLASAIRALAKGDAVTIMPLNAILTPQQAADFLLVPLPFLLATLETAELPSFVANTHRYVRVADLFAFRHSSVYRRELIKQIAHDAQDMGLYDEDYPAPADDDQP